METWKIILLFSIAGLVVFIYYFGNKIKFSKRVNKTQTKTEANTSAKTTPTTPGKPKKSRWDKFMQIFWAIVTVLCIIAAGLFIVSVSKGCERILTQKAKNTEQTSGQGKLLSQKPDEYTPCHPSLDYKFELDTQGDPIYLKFPGVSSEVYYSGKGTIKVPPRKSGPVQIRSANPNVQVRVRIWEVIRD